MKNMNREILENRIHERIMAMHDSQDVDILAAQIMDDLEQLKDINNRQLKQRQNELKEYAVYTTIEDTFFDLEDDPYYRLKAGTKLSLVKPVNNLGKKENVFHIYVLDTEQYLPIEISCTNDYLQNYVVETDYSEMSETEKEKVTAWRFRQFQNDPEIGKEDCENERS